MKKDVLNAKELEHVTGGTFGETFMLVLWLHQKGYGNFATDDNIDYDKLNSFFASKGYKFIPSEDEPNVFIDRDGVRYGQDYIDNLIKTQQL